MSEYHRRLKELQDSRCPTCYGNGECDDAEAGDMFFNTWTCPTCKGTGIKEESKRP